tara:strand:+ start:3126 stop:3494 length:369 start_codon:yes stop_codon:yes gene_type:complete
MSVSNGRFFRYRVLWADSAFDGRGWDHRKSYRTVAAVHRHDADDGAIYDVGFSFCAPPDEKKYKKSLGRTIATGRLNSGRSIRVTASDVREYGGVFDAAFCAALRLETRPSWLPQNLWGLRR